MSRQTFKTADVLRLEVENTPTGPVNLIQNPNGELGGWGWVTPVGNANIIEYTYGTTQYLLYVPPSPTAANWFTSENFRVTPGTYLSARWDTATFGATDPVKVSFEFLDAAGTVTRSAVSGYKYDDSDNVYASIQVPAGTVAARLRFDSYADVTGAPNYQGNPVRLRGVTVISRATSSDQSDFGYYDPATYTNVLGTTHTIGVKRDELNVGTLTAEILDSTLDPSRADLIRPGKRCRLTVLAGGVWEPIFTGRVSQGATKYDLSRADTKKARITMSALDAASALAQQTRPSGVATINELPYVLEGCGVPWAVNQSGNQVRTATVVTTNPDASALDQVAVTRDSVLGYAWVDRLGILQVWDRTPLNTGGVDTTLDESAYSDVDLDYDTDRCINSVTVKLRRNNAATGQTVEITYGPFVDQSSIDQWGPHSVEVTVQGITDSTSAAAAYAQQILAANATPAVRINSVTLPIRNPADLTTSKALIDLYDLAEVINTASAIDQNMRVTGLEHKITTDRWSLDLDFTIANSVATPTASADLASQVDTANPAGVASLLGGGWGTAVPTATQGFSFPLAAGVFRAICNATAYTTTGGTINVGVYFDGVLQGYMTLNASVSANVRLALSALPISATVKAGTHYIYFRQVNGTSDGGDIGSIHGTVTAT